MPLERYEDHLVTSGFTDTLFLVYQDFKDHLDKHLAEKTNPAIIKFVREQEVRAAEYLESIAGPYETMVREAVSDYLNSMDEMDISLDSQFQTDSSKNGLDAMRHDSGLMLPPMDTTMRYSARIKTEAVV